MKSKKSKKNQTRNAIIVIIAILILVVLAYYKSDKYFPEETPSYIRISTIIVGVIFILLFEFALDKTIQSKFFTVNEKLNAWLILFGVNFFKFVLFPGMLLSIIYLGAYTTRYPPTEYPNGTFMENVNKSMGQGFDAATGAFIKMTGNLYEVGKNKPNLMYYLIPITIVVLTYLSIPSKKDIEEKLEADKNAKKK